MPGALARKIDSFSSVACPLSVSPHVSHKPTPWLRTCDRMIEATIGHGSCPGKELRMRSAFRRKVSIAGAAASRLTAFYSRPTPRRRQASTRPRRERRCRCGAGITPTAANCWSPAAPSIRKAGSSTGPTGSAARSAADPGNLQGAHYRRAQNHGGRLPLGNRSRCHLRPMALRLISAGAGTRLAAQLQNRNVRLKSRKVVGFPPAARIAAPGVKRPSSARLSRCGVIVQARRRSNWRPITLPGTSAVAA